MTEASQSLYQAGALALKQAQYDEAIAALERFCQETVNRQSKQFFQAQMWLIQAYHKDHQDLHAIALCEQLARSEIPQVKQWADNALNQLMATAEPESDLASTQHAASGSGFVEDTAHPAASAQARNMASPLVSTDSFQQPTRSHILVGGSRKRPATYGAKDYSSQILSAVAHGSISMLASILLFALFADSLIANSLGLLRFAVPLIILFTTDDAGVKANAREATNYVITSLMLLLVMILGSILLAVVFMMAWPLAMVLGIALAVYLVALSIYPIVATILCAKNENYIFHYPNWLILHLI